MADIKPREIKGENMASTNKSFLSLRKCLLNKFDIYKTYLIYTVLYNAVP